MQGHKIGMQLKMYMRWNKNEQNMTLKKTSDKEWAVKCKWKPPQYNVTWQET